MTTNNSPLLQLKDPTLLKNAGYINGAWVEGEGTFAVTDPATGLELAQVANLTAAQTQQAIDAAEAALPAWRAMTHKQRSQLLRKWFELILAHQDDLARLMTAEQGKPLAEATGEVVYGASFVEWYAEEAKRTYGETVPSFAPDRRAIVLRQPIGVCAAITPWNFPVAMITRKVAPAIAAGCTVVVKPAEFTPLCALALAELAHRAGIPDGVINVIPTEHAAAVGSLWGVGAVLAAAVAYPLGNQLVWEARHGGKGRIPRIDQPSLDAGRMPTLLLTIGSIPFWLILIAVIQPPPPSAGQVAQTALVALFSGVIATTLFLRARSRAKNSYELAATDATQALEVVFCLLGETLLLAAPWPGPLGFAGIALAVCGLVLYVCRQV